jgi:uncharacterized membrane protein YraQ (UPF0718 family)
VRWYTQPKQWVLRVVVPTVAVGAVWPPLRTVALAFWDYFRLTWWAIGLGLLLGGLIERFIPSTYIAKFFNRSSPRTILLAVGLGFVFSGCSHGCLALSMALYKKGAAPAAVIGFLLASPWASLSLTLVMISLFGLKGLVIVLAALAVACATGLLFLRLERQEAIERNPHAVSVDDAFSVAGDIRRRASQYRLTLSRCIEDVKAVARGAWNLADMVVWWLVIGFFLAGVLGTVVPHAVFGRYFGATALGLLLTMALATAIETCSEGSAPLAFELFKHTGALGNSFAFLMGGVVTDVTELGLIWTNLGKKTALWMVVLTLPQVFLLGLLLNRW